MLFMLLLQAATLPSETREAATTCAQVVALADSGDSPIRLSAQLTHYMMQGAKADPGGKSFFERVPELMPKSSDPSLKSRAPALLKACDQRFPQARRTTPAKLPADPFRRDVLCLGTLAVLQGAAQEFQQRNGDGAPLTRIKAVLEPLQNKLTDDVLAAHRLIGDDAFTAFMADQMKASLAIGSIEGIAIACGLSGGL